MNNLDQPINITNGPKGLGPIDAVSVLGHPLSKRLDLGFIELPSVSLYYYLFLALVLVSIFVCHRLERSRIGRAWMAIREDEDAAESMGVNTFRFKLWAFVIGAAIGGLSGAMYAGQVQFVAPPTFNIINSMLFLAAVVLGGQGNKLGVIFGAFVIVYLPNRLLGVEVAGINLGDLKYLFFGLALVVLMIFRPQGLFPVRQQLLAYGKSARNLLRRADDTEVAS